MVSNNAVEKRSGFLVNLPMVAMIGARNCREDGRFIDDSRPAAILQRLFMALNGVAPRYAIMTPTDLPRLSLLRDVLWTFSQ